MRVRTLPLLLAVMVVSVVGTVLALQVFGFGQPSQTQRVQIVTVEVLITATPDPNATVPVIIITATTDRTQVALPPNILPEGTTLIAPTLDANALATVEGGGGATLVLPQNCITHVVQAGEAPFSIAAQYGANPFTLLQVNNLTEQTSVLLQIGDVLIVPLEGCPLDQLPGNVVNGANRNVVPPAQATLNASATAQANATEAVSPTVGATATLTLPPTAQNAQVQIVAIEKAGDVTAEGVRIRNTGNTINVTGWTLSDAQGNTYTFGERIIFSNQEVTVYTRAGQNTPTVAFWGLDTPVWGDAGDIVTLKDARGNVQATLRVGNLINLDG
jgi:LysM repeat protein